MAGAARVRQVITDRSQAPGQQHTDDDLHDLDDDDDGDDLEDDDEGGGPPRRSSRGLLAVGAAVLLALLGAALGSAHAGARAAQVDRDLRLDTALRTGAVALDGSVSAIGELRLVAVSVPLVGTGPQPVSARLVSFDAPHLGSVHAGVSSAGAPVPVVVGPVSAVVVQAAAEVRCRDVPGADPFGALPSADATPSAVVVDVGPAGAESSRRVRLPLATDEAVDLSRQLSWACHPDTGPSLQTSYRWLPDGRLRVELSNGGGAAGGTGAAVRVSASASGGVEVDASPPLPLVVEPGGEQELLLTARVDCAAAGDGSHSAVVLSAEEPVDGGAVAGYVSDISSGANGDGTPYGTSGWLSRQVALTCG